MAAAAEALESVYGEPVAVSAVRERGGGADTTATAAPRSGWDKVAPILGAIGTGVGVIGFVTFIGGVTVYARLRAPASPVRPRSGSSRARTSSSSARRRWSPRFSGRSPR